MFYKMFKIIVREVSINKFNLLSIKESNLDDQKIISEILKM